MKIKIRMVLSMETLLRNIEKNFDLENNIKLLFDELNKNNKALEQILNIVNVKLQDKSNVLNIIGVKCYENEMFEYVIPFLQKAYEYDNENQDALVNLGIVLFNIKEYELSFYYLNKIKNKNEEILSLIDEIRKNYIEPKEKEKKKIKFILRRIENDIDIEQSIDYIKSKIINNEIVVDEIIESIEKNIVKKEKVLKLLEI